MTEIALSLRNLAKSFGQTEIIRGVNLDIAKGERHAIIGPNGAGKTTLFNLISGRFPLSSGEILLNDVRVDALPPHRINRMGLSRSFQITSIFHRLSVFENLRCALLWSMGYHYSFWTPLWLQRALNERTNMEMRFRRPRQAFASQGRAASAAEATSRLPRRRIELGYLAFGNGISFAVK